MVPTLAVSIPVAGGGDAAEPCRAIDRSCPASAFPVGGSAALRGALAMLFAAEAPLRVFWGDDARSFFNDAAGRLIGAGRRFPELGRPGREVWGERWNAASHDVAAIRAGGPAAACGDRLAPLFSDAGPCLCTGLPITDGEAPGGIGGVLVVVHPAAAPIGRDRPAEVSRTWVVSPDLLCILDAEGHLEASNPAWQATLGWAEDELRRMRFIELVHPDDRARTIESWAGLRLGVPALCFENRYRTRAGSFRWLSWVAVPEGDRFYCSARDVDAEKQQAMALDRIGVERERLWQSSRDILFALDRDGTLVSVNPAATAILGWTQEELVGSQVFDWIVEDDLAVTREALVDARRATMGTFENRYRHKDGGFRWMSWVASPEGDLVFASGRHITAEKEAGLALARTLAERDRIWRHSRDVVTVIDLRGLIVAVNPAAEDVLGWAADDMIGRSVMDFIHPDDRPPLRADGGMIAERYAQPRVSVNRFRHKNGSERRISWLSSGDDGLIYSSGRDITAQTEQAEALRAAEERLRQSQKMEAVGQLTGGIAHDFNNLLMGIGGSLQLMHTRIGQGRIAELDRYAVAAQCNVRRAAALTHRLLAFSRRQTLDPKPTDVNRLVADMEDLIRRSIGPAIGLEVDGDPALWTTFVDANQLENAILNLCLNARDAMPDGGHIAVVSSNRRLDEAEAREREVAAGEYVSISVRDTGTGMTPTVAARAFEPFFTTKPIGTGTGLGLSMIYGFARQSGGQVRIETEPGRGTTMRLDLPRHAGDADAVAPRRTAVAMPRAETGETVLVVEDEPTVRMLLAEALQDAGFAVLEAAEGASALRILETGRRIDLLVTDIGLPGGLNGRQVAHAAQALRPGLKVLFVTGYAEQVGVGDDPAAATAILTKPFAIEALGAKVGALLRP